MTTWRGWRRPALAAALVVAALAVRPVFGDATGDAADAVQAAAKAGDSAALEAAAAKDTPDPWVVTDELLARGDADAATRFAKARPRKDVEKLPAYVAAHAGRTDDAESRKAVGESNVRLRANDVAGALAAIDAVKTPGDDVASTRLAFGRGIALRSLGQPDDAQKAFADSASRALRIGWVARASDALQQAANAAMGGGDPESALRHWTAKLEIDRARENQSQVARTLVNMGTAHDDMGDAAKARDSYEQAAKIAEACGDRMAVAAAAGNEAILLRREGELARSTEMFERVVLVMHEAGDRVNEAASRINLSDNHLAAGDLPKALAEADRALELVGDAGDPGMRGDLLHHRVSALIQLGRYAEALAALEHAGALFEKAGSRQGLAANDQMTGNVFFSMGQYAKALSLQEKGLAAFEALGANVSIAKGLMSVGNTCLALADYPRALDFQRRALAAFEALGDRSSESPCRSNIGGTLARVGRNEEAAEEFRKAVAIAEELGSKEDAAKALGNLGSAYDALGRADDAIGCYERALAMQREMGVRESEAICLGNLGRTYWEGKKDAAKGIDCLTRSITIARETESAQTLLESLWGLSSVCIRTERWRECAAAAREAIGVLPALVESLGEAAGARAREQYAPLFEEGAVAAMKMDDPEEAAFFMESGRAGTLLESLGGRSAIAAFSIPTPLRSQESDARAELDAAVAAQRAALEARKVAAIQDARKRVAAARDRVEAAVERIQREAKVAASVAYPTAAKLGDIRKRLRPGETFVEYGVFAKAVIAVVATRQTSRVLHLGATEEIDAACAGIDPSDPGSDAGKGVDALRRAVIGPLGLDASTTRVLVSPDGALCTVPFALLLPDREVAEVPSGSAYLLLSEGGAAKGEQVLALGDPVYDGAAGAVATRSLQGAKLTPLPGTRAEAEAVGDVVLLGADATVPGLAAAAAKRERWHAIHLACHGLVDPEHPALSSLALSAADGDDGLLKALDVYRMKLPADIVVLSACETGRGKVIRGEGIVGFTRGFMFAGAPRVVVSLWKVDDQATRALMEHFHAAWKAGTPAARALREAQEFVRSKEPWRHPSYWAAWVLWGLPE